MADNLPQFDGAKALAYTRQYVDATGPRWIGSPGHVKAEAFLKEQFRHDQLEEDTFTTDTPAGAMTMHNFIVKFPGKKDGSSSSPRTTRRTIRCATFITSAPTMAAQPPAC